MRRKNRLAPTKLVGAGEPIVADLKSLLPDHPDRYRRLAPAAQPSFAAPPSRAESTRLWASSNEGPSSRGGTPHDHRNPPPTLRFCERGGCRQRRCASIRPEGQAWPIRESTDCVTCGRERIGPGKRNSSRTGVGRPSSRARTQGALDEHRLVQCAIFRDPQRIRPGQLAPDSEIRCSDNRRLDWAESVFLPGRRGTASMMKPPVHQFTEQGIKKIAPPVKLRTADGFPLGKAAGR